MSGVHTTQSSWVEPVAKHHRISMEQASSLTPVLIATEARPSSSCSFVFLLHIESANSCLLMVHQRRHLLIHHHPRYLLVYLRLMKPWLLSYTLHLFLRPWNPSLSKASIAEQHYQYMWLLFLSWINVLWTKTLNAENTEPLRTVTEAMWVKAWNDATSYILPFAWSGYKRCSHKKFIKKLGLF